MPLTATLEDIKAHQQKVEKNKIAPDDLGPCPRCHLESIFFKLHAYRERRFLVIVDLLVKAVFCTLVRFRCTDCGKTITSYPDFAIPHKHYTCFSKVTRTATGSSLRSKEMRRMTKPSVGD